MSLRRTITAKGAPKTEAGRINLEYVSANPTGPMHVGHGRWAALGDAMARVMRHAGYDVSEEFYINDHGVQMDVFGNSVSVRYQQLLGRDVPMPENGYGGSYIKDIAQSIIDRDGDKMGGGRRARRRVSRDGLPRDAAAHAGHARQLRCAFDRWFSERSLYVPDEADGRPCDRALQAMDEKGYLFEKDGATWFKLHGIRR